MAELIDRQAAIKTVLTYLVEYCGAAFDEDMQRTLKERLDSLPSAESERKTGKWMLFENQRQEDIDSGNYMYTCSNCLRSDIHAKTVNVPYCWFCGAKMEMEQE